MRIEKLEFNKIKVTVFPVDLIDMNININSLTPDSPDLHIFLSSVMEKIKEETGFNPYSKKTVVEASLMGDCMVLTVTKITEKNIAAKKPDKRRVKAVLKNQEIKKSVCFFESFDDMCKAISLISRETLLCSRLYKIENKFAISVFSLSEDEMGILKEFSYDTDVNSLASHFLSEHGEIIAKGESLVSLAEGIKSL